MQDRPTIDTAIPKRRYQIGDYAATLLGDIQSRDGRRFLHILAFVPMGQREPTLYICAEQPTADVCGQYQLRVINEVMNEHIDTSERWGDMETFAEEAVKLGSRLLGLQQEEIVRLM
jgi:hypothetical protein